MTTGLLEQYFKSGADAGCGLEQMRRFAAAGVVLQPRQLVASAAARACDRAGGPEEVGYGGARAGGKSYWLLAQMGVDDCQRVPGLKCLLLRKVGKANIEHFDDLRRQVFPRLNHDFVASRGVLTFSNGSRIVAGHFQTEGDIDGYLGLEYDVIGVEEATTLTQRKYEHIRTCCRCTAARKWRPRVYSTTNAGGVGHSWYRTRFVDPYRAGTEAKTRFVPAKVTDNRFCNEDYRGVLEGLAGWERRAWLEGDWDIAAGQFFLTFRREHHVVSDPPTRDSGSPLVPPSDSQLSWPVRLGPLNSQLPRTLNLFDPSRAREWFAALDYGYAHYTVVLLGCTDGDGNLFVVDEHAARLQLPEAHARGIRAMLARHGLRLGDLRRFVAGGDVFSRQSDGTSVAKQYGRFGIHLRAANVDRVAGWAEIMARLGDPERGISPRLFFHERCRRLVSTLPDLQHDPARPEDVLKVDTNEQGVGGDDAADALRYLVATQPRRAGFSAAV